MLGNFHSRFNTVAKLNNFTYAMDEVEKLGEDISVVKAVLEYDTFRTECLANVSYMMSIESVESVKQKIEDAKGSFRKTRDDIADGKYGETAAMEANEELSAVKGAYIDVYFEEHKKRRLDVKSGKHKSDLISSAKYANLKRLAEIEILSATKFNAIGADLAALKICIELTPEMLKTSHFCPKCGFQLGGADPLVKGAVEKIEDRLDALSGEWTKTLLNTLSDPLVLTQKGFLASDKQKAIDDFLAAKALPEKVDSFFVNAVKELLTGFDAVTVSGTELIDKLSALGPCDTDTFKAKIDEVVTALSKGKDKAKLRIIIRG
jgi:hypothetical protein